MTSYCYCRSIPYMAVVLICVGTSSSAVWGQHLRRYQPASPTISPYVNLTRFNNGTVPNYYSLVRPLQQQRQLNLQEQALRQQQALTLGRVESDLRLGTTPVVATGTGSRFLINGTRSTFLNTSRYYTQPTLGQRRR